MGVVLAEKADLAAETEIAEVANPGMAGVGFFFFTKFDKGAGTFLGPAVAAGEFGILVVGVFVSKETFFDPRAGGGIEGLVLERAAKEEEKPVGIDAGLEFEVAGELFGFPKTPAGLEGEGGVEAMSDFFNEGDELVDVLVVDVVARVEGFEVGDELRVKVKGEVEGVLLGA
jgi:hypothetical protein